MEGFICFSLTLQILASAATSRENITFHKDMLNVTAGQSLLLPTSYTLSPQSSAFVIQWVRSPDIIIYYYANNSSLDHMGTPKWVEGEIDAAPKYQRRVVLYPLNASLLLKDVELNDTGIYTLSISNSKKQIHVWVHKPASNTAKTNKKRLSLLVFTSRVVLCFIPAIALLFVMTL